MMAGLKRKISTPDGIIHTRSLMVADLRKAETVKHTIQKCEAIKDNQKS
jgi:hypothetical protein